MAGSKAQKRAGAPPSGPGTGQATGSAGTGAQPHLVKRPRAVAPSAAADPWLGFGFTSPPSDAPGAAGATAPAGSGERGWVTPPLRGLEVTGSGASAAGRHRRETRAGPAWVEVATKPVPGGSAAAAPEDLACTRLVVHRGGAVDVWRKEAASDGDGGGGTVPAWRLVAQAQLTLPTPPAAEPRLGWRGGVDAAGQEYVDVSFGVGAVLRVHRADGGGLCPASGGASGGFVTGDWAAKLQHGLVLQYRVARGLADCAEIKVDVESAGHWFGGGHLMRQLWPLNRATWELGPHFPFDNGPTGLNTLVAPHFVTSSGFLLMADPATPFLHVGMNTPLRDTFKWIERKWGVGIQNLSRTYLPLAKEDVGGPDLCCGYLKLQARRDYHLRGVHHPLVDWRPNMLQPARVGADQRARPEDDYLALTVAVGAHAHVRAATEAALHTLPAPDRLPDSSVLQKPIWTTWARYHSKVNQAKVLRYAREICDRGLARSVMEIDDRWQTRYGDIEFDPRKFPDPKAMVDELHALGFKVTVWVMPFAQKASAALREGGPKGYYCGQVSSRGTVSEKPGFFHWWNTPKVAALDVTNPEAVAWFVAKLRRLQERYGVDGFKFDGGEPCFLPKRFQTLRPLAHPSEYSELYVKHVAGQFEGGVSEVRTGHRTQGVGLLTRMGDRFSTWGVDNGLQSVIPTLLTSSILGYPFCLPDMIGGNAYFGTKPDPELMVRWTQASALMPALQFSIAPWDLGPQVDELCQKALEIRGLLGDRLGELAEGTAQGLAPIARPLWWLDPEDENTFGVADQFALGDDIVVAPVVTRGAGAREVYLPRGTWRDALDPGAGVYEGGRAHAVDAPLDKLPVFFRTGTGPSPPAPGPNPSS